MGLRNLSFAPATVEVPGGESFTVRGLSPDKVITLYNRHTGQLSALWDSRENITEVQDLIVSLLSDAPDIMAELIAIASGSKVTDDFVEPDTEVNPLGLTDYERDVEAARSLPLPVQMEALLKIGELTFSSSMPPGKFLAVVIKLAGKATAAFSQSAKS
ncbi:phage pre-tape measure protein [Novosphingobium resinovorum]|uniref:Uncharacterized protein n=1 Tax=Novosphingobium resinovorum TaxID=158500 RepID=A0A1D8A3D0_9SPHN|nr:hypothetical protein [Novosphingobium resinovorum]AOR76570.1 hypothetical protein BES08_07270 [Novosphingobium resinovorum]